MDSLLTSVYPHCPPPPMSALIWYHMHVNLWTALAYGFVLTAKLRGKMKDTDESVFLFARWTVSGRRTPDWLSWMNPTAVSTQSISTPQSCLHCHRERSILCAIGTTLQINLVTTKANWFCLLHCLTYFNSTSHSHTQCGSWRRGLA